MAVNGYSRPSFNSNGDSDDDDDGPAIFKRTSSAPKQNQPNSTSKKLPSQKNDDTRGRPLSNQGTHNGESSSSLKSKPVSNSKLSTEKSRLINSNSCARAPIQSNHASNNGASNSNTGSPHMDISTSEVKDSKPQSSKLVSGNQRSSSNITPKVECSDSNKTRVDKSSKNKEESDDEKSLSARFSSASMAKATGSCIQSELSQKIEKTVTDSSDGDSEDEKPLFTRLKSISTTTVVKDDSERKLPSSKQTLNGSNKRPREDFNSLTESSTKKVKTSSASATIKVKNEAVVKEERADDDDDDDHTPIAQRMKKPVPSKSQSSTKIAVKKETSTFKKKSTMVKKNLNNSKKSKSSTVPPGSGGGKKWTTLEHNGVIFPPPYKPHGVKMLYDGKPVDLTPEQEEVATMFAVMKETDYASKPKFIENFMNDWRKILGKSHIIKKFELCDFTPIYEWHLEEKEKKKQLSSEEKKAIKEEKMKQEEKYMWAIVDGVKEKVGNFRVEPPGLFRGRGEHPKMGMLKRRIRPKDIIINIGKNATVPECPIPGERWGEVRHDNTVTWLAYWNDPINPREFKYVFLAASSSLKGQSDKEKYEKARRLKDYIEGIRATYTKNFTSKDATKRQIAVATYLIDKLALRAGNEKDDDEADTVGCCTLKVENVTCVPPNMLQFDFLGKDSIRYYNTVEVELPVYKAIGDFQTATKSDGKKKVEGDDLFDMLDTSKLNAHLKELMPSLTAKVFRTYNASITLDSMLNEETNEGSLLEKITIYQRANKQVAIICNHQRSVSKSHEAQMSRLNEKIDELKVQRNELVEDLNRAKKGKPSLGSKRNLSTEMLEKKLNQVDAKIEKMESDKNNREELKTVALGTSKINYLDPRISVAWCKRNEVPIEKIFNKSLMAKFAWAMDVEPDYRF